MFWEKTTHVSSVLFALSIGALAGAGLTMLYAPRSGKKTRDLIVDKSRELKEKAEETINDAHRFIKSKI